MRQNILEIVSRMITYDKLFIGGRWIAPADPELLEIRSPHDHRLLGLAAQGAPADIDKAVSAAREAFDHGPWPRMTPEVRQEIVARFTKLRGERAEDAAALISAENGAPLWFTKWGAPALDRQAAAYLDAAKDFGWEETLPSKAVVRREPIGVVAAVIPWNSPYMAATVKMIPALLAGCTVVLKASPENSLSILRLAESFAAAGFPDGVVSIIPADRETSEHLVAHPGVDKIAFTGSTAAGRRIASIAGEQLKRVSLELGGKSASILLEDADLAAVTEGLKFASFGNNAENCQAHTRILAPASRYDEVVDALKVLVESLKVGDPADPETFIGPMIRADQQKRVQDYIRLGIDEGARLVTGGPETPEGLEGGFYVRPTLFADVDNKMRIAQEEIFGPVLVVIPYDDEDDAIRIANDSPYGLGGGVWTTDPARGMEIARRMATGGVRINAAQPVFDGPFGGYKASGIGRENGTFGLTEYVEHKTIAV